LVQKQLDRAHLLFELYPDLQKACSLSQGLRNIFEKTADKIIGLARFSKCHVKIKQSGFKSFNTISRTITNHYQAILYYFDKRSTNTSAECFDAKIKAVRSQFRDVRNIEFFFFSLTNLYGIKNKPWGGNVKIK
jgi:transposase